MTTTRHIVENLPYSSVECSMARKGGASIVAKGGHRQEVFYLRSVTLLQNDKQEWGIYLSQAHLLGKLSSVVEKSRQLLLE